MRAELYFPELYWHSELLLKLGLDYWVLLSQYVEPKQELSLDNAAKIFSEIEQREHLLGEIEDPWEREYFRGKYDRLTGHLRSVIERNESGKL